MNTEAIRGLIVAQIQSIFDAQLPSLKVVYDNGPFDWNNPPPAFAEVEIKFYGGSQVGMAAAPKTRFNGYVYVQGFTRKGTGSKQSLAVVDVVGSALEYLQIGKIHFQAADPTGSTPSNSWYSEGLKVAFYVDP